jgi:Sulfotransferase family
MKPSEKARLKLVYILGSGRCGSTILDAAIGTARSVVSTGELESLSDAIRASQNGDQSGTLAYCSCGSPIAQCPLWSAVWSDFSANHEIGEFDRDRYNFERLFLSIPHATTARLTKSPALERHLEALSFLVRTAAVHEGATVVVDSSKNPCRGSLYALLSDRDFDVRFVHLVRDGRRVLSSILDHYHPEEVVSGAPPWSRSATALYYTAYWAYMNLHSSILGAFHRRKYLRVRYEDLVSQPMETLSSIESFLEIDLSEVRSRVAAGLPLSKGHIVFGNRSKADPVLKVQAKAPTEAKLPLGPSIIFGALASWLQALYRTPHPE